MKFNTLHRVASHITGTEFAEVRNVLFQQEGQLLALRGMQCQFLTRRPQQARSWLRWSRGSVLAFGTQVRVFKPGRSRRIFQGEKILSRPSYGRKVNPFVPCRRFTECKISLNVTWKSGIFRQNSSGISRPCSSTFGC